MLALLVYMLVALCIFALVWWVVGQLALPQPVRMVVIVVMAIVGIIFLLNLVVGLGGMPHLSVR